MNENNYPIIISFYTNTWEYPNYAKKMKLSCEKLGLEHYIVEEKDTGNWLKNTAKKPSFIYKTLQHFQTPLLWIDVDGSILKKPELLKNCDFDFAARKKDSKQSRVWHVGTMFFNYTEPSLNFLKLWNERMETVDSSDELCLDIIWKEQSDIIKKLSVKELPKEYFEMLRQLNHTPSKETIICHRASKGESKMKMKERTKNKR